MHSEARAKQLDDVYKQCHQENVHLMSQVYHIISMRVCVCVCALREVTGSDSTSRQMLLLSLGDGDCRPKRGCPVSWHP